MQPVTELHHLPTGRWSISWLLLLLLPLRRQINSVISSCSQSWGARWWHSGKLWKRGAVPPLTYTLKGCLWQNKKPSNLGCFFFLLFKKKKVDLVEKRTSCFYGPMPVIWSRLGDRFLHLNYKRGGGGIQSRFLAANRELFRCFLSNDKHL